LLYLTADDFFKDLNKDCPKQINWQNFDTFCNNHSLKLEGWPLEGPVKKASKLTVDQLDQVCSAINAGTLRWSVHSSDEGDDAMNGDDE
jgi:hypothetical protein